MGCCCSTTVDNGVQSTITGPRNAATQSDRNTGNPSSGPKIFVLVGQSGSGKSSFVEQVTGQTGLSSNRIRPFTNEIKEYVTTIDGSNICLVDTPGFEGPMAILAWLKAKHPGQKLTGLLYFHDISKPRLEDTNNLQGFRILCGKNLNRLVFTLTHYNAAQHVERERLLKRDLASETANGATVAHFENDRTSALQILKMRMTESDSDPQPSQPTHD